MNDVYHNMLMSEEKYEKKEKRKTDEFGNVIEEKVEEKSEAD